MGIQQALITIDCLRPRELAGFWTKALGVEVAMDLEGGYVVLQPASENATALAFQQVPEERSGKNRVHVDFLTEEREKEVERLVGLGARELSKHDEPGIASWTVLADPEGNEFCVATHQG